MSFHSQNTNSRPLSKCKFLPLSHYHLKYKQYAPITVQMLCNSHSTSVLQLRAQCVQIFSEISQVFAFKTKEGPIHHHFNFFGSFFNFFIVGFGPFCLHKLLNRNIVNATKNTFRKSVQMICHYHNKMLCHSHNKNVLPLSHNKCSANLTIKIVCPSHHTNVLPLSKYKQ